MSRIGKMPVKLPAGVEVEVKGGHVRVKGPKGELSHVFPSNVQVSVQDNAVVVKRSSDSKFDRAMHGTARALVNNYVLGVSRGFEKELEIQGVGYRAEMQGKNLVLHVGYSHPVTMEPPAGIQYSVDEKTRYVKVAGYDKEVVGQLAAEIRQTRPPEPYQGKGIRYVGEYVHRKAGKAKATAA